MNRTNPWDVSASGPPVASGQVPFYNPAQFQQDHSPGSAMAPSSTFGDAGHRAGIDDMSANYPYEQGWHNNWNNFGAWPHAQGYNSASYGGNYYFQQQHSGDPVAPLSEAGVVGSYHGELMYNPNWSANQTYEQYPTQYAETGEYDYDPTIVGGYDNLSADVVDSSSLNTSQSVMQTCALHDSEESRGMSPFFHQGGKDNLSGLPLQVVPANMVMGGLEQFSSEQLPAVNSFSNIIHQPSPFDELGDMKSPPRIGLLEQSLLPTSHSRQSSAGGGVQFLIGGSSSVSESQSRTDSPHALGMEAASASTECEQDEIESKTVVTEHAGVTQPHFTDAGSHKNLTGRIDDSPVHSLLPQGTMTGTPASGHHRKPTAGPVTPLELSHVPPDFTAPLDADATEMLSCSAYSEFVQPEASISEEFITPQQPSHQMDDSQLLAKAEDDSEYKTDMYTRPLGSHPDSSFTPVGNALAMNAAMSPGQQFTNSLTAAVPHMQTGSVCSAAGSDGGTLDMHEIELDAMVDSGSPQDARRVEAGRNVEAVGECRAGSGTFKHNLHDANTRSYVHQHVKAHRDVTMSPATTLWENPEPTGVRLLPVSAASTESRSTVDKLLTHELPQNTDAGPSKSGASGIVHEPSLDVHSAMHPADDQRVPQTPLTNTVLSQTSHASYMDHSVPSQVMSASSSRTIGYQSVVHPVTSPDISSTVRNESIDSLSEELARSSISSVDHYSHTSNSVPPKPSHVAVVQTSGKPSDSIITVPAGNVVAGRNVTQGTELRPSVGSKVEHTGVMVVDQTPDARKQNVKHAADHNQHSDDKNNRGNVQIMQNSNHQGIPHGEKVESRDVEVSSQKSYNQQNAHREFDDSVHAMKSKQQPVTNSVSDVPDERHRTSRYRAEVDRSRSRQDDMDQVSRRPLSRQGYDDRAYNRPHSRQDYEDRDYARPHSRPGYDYGYEQQVSEDPYGRPRSRQGHEQPVSRQVSEDPSGRQRSRQGYEQPVSRQVSEDPYGQPRSGQGYEYPYYRPSSSQGSDDRRDMSGAGQSYIYPEDGQQQRPAYEGRRDRPSSRQSYHEPVDRPRSRQEHDYRPRSRQDYEYWSARNSRDHETVGTRYRDNRYANADSYKRPASSQEFSDGHHDSRKANRYPDESFNRPRHNAPDEEYDRMSLRHQDDPNDPRYRPSQGYREEEYRRPRSRGGGQTLFLCI